MRRYVFRLAILTLAMLGPSVVRADDQQIAQQIVEKLQAEKQAGTLKGFSIDLQVEEGTVWLSGRVSDSEQQAKALDIARRIPGVVQVVNDLNVAAPATTGAPAPASARPANRARDVFSNMSRAFANASRRGESNASSGESYTGNDESGVMPAAAAEAIGSGVAQPAPARVATATPMVQPSQPAYGPPSYAQPMPVYAGSRQQVPLAFAPARMVAHEAAGPFHRGHHGHHGGYPIDGGMGEPVAENIVGDGGPVPMHMGGGMGMAPARYDHPSMPGYAWPSYAAYPNYAAVTYPRQYSPTAWPYIGPFYPYPQVPLGWRKVTLEWDDGWWMLDFKDRRTMYNH
jgi:hypothetical protein